MNFLFSYPLNITGVSADLRYRFYDPNNLGIGIWRSNGVVENSGVYSVQVEIPVDAKTFRWEKTSSPPAMFSIDVSGFNRLGITERKGFESKDQENYSLFWDTKDYLNGNKTITAYALGSDGLWSKSQVNVSLNNTLKNNYKGKEFFLRVAKNGYYIIKPQIAIDSYKILNGIDSKGFLEIGVSKGTLNTPNTTIKENIDSWWGKFQTLVIEKGASWKLSNNSLSVTREDDYEISQFFSSSDLNFQSKDITYGLRVSPYEVQFGYDISSEKVLKVRTNNDEVYFGTSNPAALYTYKDTLTKSSDLSNYGFNEIKDISYKGDKIYIISSLNDLIVIDTTAGDYSNKIINISETKTLSNIEVVGGIIHSIYKSDSKTTCYRLEDTRKLWEKDFTYERIIQNGDIFYFVNGRDLWVSVVSSEGLGEPTKINYSDLSSQFPDPVKDVSKNNILTSNGINRSTIYSGIPNGYTTLLNMPEGNFSSIVKSLSNDRIMVGKSNENSIIDIGSDLLIKSSKMLKSREINPQRIVGIESLYAKEKIITPASGSVLNGNYVPPTYESKFFAFSKPDSQNKRFVFVIEVNPLVSSDKAILVSKFGNVSMFIEDIERDGTTRPEEDHEEDFHL